MDHILVIGFMGSGKTRVGKRLSQDFNLPFIDVDKEISAKLRLTKKELYQRFGEPFYRALETKAIKDVLESKQKTIVSVGAGLPVQEQNFPYIQQFDTVIYLKGESFQVLMKRIEAGGSNESPERLRKLYDQRTPFYERFATLTVVTGDRAFEELVKEVEEKLEKSEKNS